VVVAGPGFVEFGNQDPRDMVLFVRLIHDVVADMLAHRRVEKFFFDHGVDFQFSDSPRDNLLFLGRRFRFLEFVERSLTVS
jgi:hypothetical protein